MDEALEKHKGLTFINQFVKLVKQLINSFGKACYRALGRSREDLFSEGGFRDITPTRLQGNDQIRSIIEAGRPRMISRLGFVEANAVLNHIEIQAGIQSGFLGNINAKLRGLRSRWDENLLSMLHKNAGVFPNDHETALRFCKVYLQCFSQMDIMGVFGEIPGEYFLWSKYCPSASVIDVQSLEPYRCESPWSAALEGKKVLVIHPFSKTISEQYRKRCAIFPGKDVLPDFQLEVMPAVQSICGSPVGFDTWFDALDSMRDKMSSLAFDVCIIGAGAYGLPLCCHAKKLGKIGIHMGGSTQILFGIKGSRWERFIPEVAELYNEAWIRPHESERPQESQTIEGGCYW